MRGPVHVVLTCLFVVLVFANSGAVVAVAEEGSSVSGTLTANGETIELPYVYVIAEEEGFYDSSDPAWRVIFAAEPIEARELDSFFLRFPYVKIALTVTSEFGDEAELQVYGQDIKISTEGSNLSGGSYPEVEMESAGPDLFAGRIFHTEEQEFFDDTFQYDFTFTAPLSDPNAPIGDPLPAGGGEPGQAYLAWVETIHALDIERLKGMVLPEMAEMLDADDAMETLEFMKEMTASDIEILSGSSDGSTAILHIRGLMDGEIGHAEVTLSREEDLWIPTSESWE